MCRLRIQPLALMLGLALAGSAVEAAPPRQPGEGPAVPRGGRSIGAMPTRVYDNTNAGTRPRYASDHIIVRFGPQVSATMRRQITWSLGGRDYVPARFGDFGRVLVHTGEDPREIARRFRNNSSVEMAEVDWLVHAAQGRARIARDRTTARATAAGTRRGRAITGSTSAISAPAGDHARSTARTTGTLAPITSSGLQAAQDNPEFVALQWHLNKIRTQQAESINGTRGAGVVVAVLDTGVGLGGGAQCQNGIPNDRGLDLDGTRFVPGRDIIGNDNRPFDEGGGDPNFPSAPRFGHGTFVTTVIAATVDNGIAGRGVAPRVSIMPVRVLGRSGSGTFSGLAEGINFAVAHGADVINMSLGANLTPAEWNSTPAAAAVRNAHAAGVVLVAATGNEADEPNPPGDVGFPARDADVIAVGATRFNDRRASYSNFGPGIDVMAPGGENPFAVVNDQTDQRDAILSPTMVHCPNPADCNGVPTLCAAFWGIGTSFATPQVAAAAALLKAVGVEDPDVIRTWLQGGSRDLAAPGFDVETGHGLLDIVESHEGFGFSFE